MREIDFSQEIHAGTQPVRFNEGYEDLLPVRQDNAEPAPAGAMHAPELSEARVTGRNENAEGVVTVRYSNGYSLTQFTRGAMRGAELLLDPHGRVVRQLEGASAAAVGRPRLQFDYTYPVQPNPADPHRALSLTIRNAATQQTIASTDMFRAAGPNPSPLTIRARPDGCDLTNGQRRDSIRLDGAQSSEMLPGSGGAHHYQFVVQQASNVLDRNGLPSGDVWPAGAVVNHIREPGGRRSTIVTMPDGNESRHYDWHDGALRLLAIRFEAPISRQFIVANRVVTITDITMLLPHNGDLHLIQNGTNATILRCLNGVFTEEVRNPPVWQRVNVNLRRPLDMPILSRPRQP